MLHFKMIHPPILYMTHNFRFIWQIDRKIFHWIKECKGKMCSNLQIIIGIYDSKFCIFWTFIFVEVRCMKNKLNLVNACQTVLSRSSRNIIGNNPCIHIWQSWLFISKSLYFYISTHLPILDTYPSRNLKLFTHSHKIYFYYLSRV